MIGSLPSFEEVSSMRRAMGVVLVLGAACAAMAGPIAPVTGPLAGSGKEYRYERRGEPREVKSADRRKNREERRVEKTTPAVQLTKGEQTQLETQLKLIQELEQKLRQPGLSPTERAKLQMQLNRAARDVNKLSSSLEAPPASPAPPSVPPPSAK
jgi:hypothetical protein